MKNDSSSILWEQDTCRGIPLVRERSLRLSECCEHMEHPSGLSVLLLPKPTVTTYAMLIVRYGAGDRHFRLGEREITLPDGVAHFLEHKLFARPDGSDVNELFSAQGAEANAWTDYDRTAYLFSTAEPADGPLATLVDFVFTPHFTPENVAHERGIIKEEIAMGEDDPWQTLYEQTMRAMYAHHAVRRKICGTAASIGRITDELLRLTHTAFYRPDQMYLVVCGNITMERILAAIDGPLSALLQRESAVLPIRLYTPEGRGVLRRRVSRRGRVAKPIFQIAWKDAPLPLDPAARVRRETVMDLLSEMLFSRAGSFYHELFEKGKITPSYSYGYSTLGGENGLAYHSITGESDDPTAVLAAYEEYLKQIRKTGLDREDFERCRRVMYAGFVAGFDFVDDMADAMCEAKGNGNGLFDALQVIEQLTFEEVQSAFDAAFDPKTTVLSTIVPIDTEENE